MRIVLLTTALARGGAETQVAHLAAGLRRMGHDASIISLTEPEAFNDVAPIYSLRMRPGVANPLGLAQLVALLRRLRPHILHAHMFHANVMARIAGTVCPAPVICTLHSLAESSRDSANAGRRDFVYRVTDPLSRVIVAVSQAVAQRHAGARAVSRRKLRIIPNGVDASRFHPDADSRARIRQQLGIRDEFVWLAAGRLMWKKDYPTLLTAFGSVGGVLLIAGTGPQEAELRAAAPEGVRFVGARDDIAELMQAADGFVLSSVVEGLPVALLEAAASGLVCVATDVGGVRDILPSSFVVAPRKPEELADKLRSVMNMPAEARKTAGEALRARVLADYDIDAVVSRWLALYREVANGDQV